MKKGFKSPKTIGEWLCAADLIGTDIIVWVNGDEEYGPLWEGSAYDFPLRYANLKLCYETEDIVCEKPIEFRQNLGKEHNNKSGFVVIVEE